MTNAKEIFGEAEQQMIVHAIKEAEANTSGEIRVHVENRCKVDPLLRVQRLFKALNMHHTEARNGVLIYLAVKDRQFAIFGDQGIDDVIPAGFWEEIKEDMLKSLQAGAFVDAVTKAVLTTGEELKKYFPYQSDDSNELPDEISFED